MKKRKKNSTKKAIKKKRKNFLFSWSLSWSSSCFLPCFLFFLIAFLVELFFSFFFLFSYFLVFFYKFPPLDSGPICLRCQGFYVGPPDSSIWQSLENSKHFKEKNTTFNEHPVPGWAYANLIFKIFSGQISFGSLNFAHPSEVKENVFDRETLNSSFEAETFN